jgi:hypothetical protein
MLITLALLITCCTCNIGDIAMAMTKKDFQIITDHINVALRANGDMLDAMCMAFKNINPAFNKDKFLAACAEGVTFKKEKLEVGDRVVCIATSTGSSYSVGDLGTVEDVDSSDDEVPYYIKWDSGDEHWVFHWEVEHKP